MTFPIYILLSILGVFLFSSGKHSSFLMVVVFLTFDLFGLLGDWGIGDYCSDIMVLMCVTIIIVDFLKGNRPLKIRDDIIGRSIVLILFWVVLRYVFSVISGEETTLYGLKVIRHDLFLFSYFVFRKISLNSYTLFFKRLIPIVFIIGSVSLLLFVLDYTTSGSLFQRKALLTLATPLLFMLLTRDISYHLRLVCMMFLFLFIGMTMARGFFIATCASIAFFFIFLKKRSISDYLLIVPLLLLFYIAYSRIESKQTEGGGKESALSELREASDMESYQEFKRGSFLLRYGMAWERMDYLISNPKYLVFGVGAIHEDSPNNIFQFKIGSGKELHDSYHRQMIDTDDIALLSHIFRYGLVYLFLFLLFVVQCFRAAWRARHLRFMQSLIMLLLTMCISVVSLDNFSRSNRFIVALMLVGLLGQFVLKKKKALQQC